MLRLTNGEEDGSGGLGESPTQSADLLCPSDLLDSVDSLGMRRLTEVVAMDGFAVRFRKLGNRLRRPDAVLAWLFLIVLAYLVVVPLISLTRTTLVWGTGDLRIRGENVEVGKFTLYHWRRMISGDFAKAVFYKPLVNTLTVTAGTVALILAVGSLLAYLVVRTDVRWAKLIGSLAIVPYILPSWVLSLAWLQVFQNSTVAMPEGLLSYYTGVNAPEWLVYGPLPIAITMGLHYYPFGYLLVSGALTSIDSQLEESAEILGAGKSAIMRRITMPIIKPALFSTALLGIARSMGTFGTPAILGLPARYYTLSTQIYSLIRTQREGQGYILAIVLLLISGLGLWANQRMISARRSYATIGGKGVKSRKVRLGKWNTPIALITLLFLFAVAVFPLAFLSWSSLTLNAGDYSIGNLGLHYWIGRSNPRFAAGEPGILRNEAVLGAVWNSVRLSIIGGLLCGFLGMLIGYVVARARKSLASRLLEQISFVPMLVPSIVFGALYLTLFAVRRGPVPALYGTFALLVLVTVVKQLPYTVRSGVSSMLQVSAELEEAAVILGAPWMQRLRKIMLPLTRSGFVAGSLIVLITSMRELSLYILLVTPANRVLTTLTYRYVEVGYTQFSNAMTVLLTVLVVVLTYAINAWQKTDLAAGLGGR